MLKHLKTLFNVRFYTVFDHAIKCLVHFSIIIDTRYFLNNIFVKYHPSISFRYIGIE